MDIDFRFRGFVVDDSDCDKWCDRAAVTIRSSSAASKLSCDRGSSVLGHVEPQGSQVKKQIITRAILSNAVPCASHHHKRCGFHTWVVFCCLHISDRLLMKLLDCTLLS